MKFYVNLKLPWKKHDSKTSLLENQTGEASNDDQMKPNLKAMIKSYIHWGTAENQQMAFTTRPKFLIKACAHYQHQMAVW